MSRQGFPTRQAAEEALGEVVAEQARRTIKLRSGMTVGDYLNGWYVGARPSLRPTTAGNYEQAIRRLDKHLGSIPLQDLTPMEVQRCYTDLLTSGGRDGGPLAPKTVRHAHVVLRKALGDAARMGVVPRNVATLAQPPSSDSPVMNTWSSSELRRFLSAVEGQPYEIGWRLLAATGLRRGEVLGLRWRDVDLDLGVLAVSNTISEVGADVVIGPPKTAKSRRNVYMDRRTVAALREHRQRQHEQKLAADAAWDNAGDWVVTDERGRYVRPQTMSYEWRVLMEKLDLPTIRLHDLRHTHATLALKAGVHPKVVSERLGHATVAITLDLYSHVVPSLAKDAAEQIMQATYADGESMPVPRSVSPVGPPTRGGPTMTEAPGSNAADETSSDWSTVLMQLRSDGFSRTESIRITKAVLHLSLVEAETVVNRGSAWAEMRDDDAPETPRSSAGWRRP